MSLPAFPCHRLVLATGGVDQAVHLHLRPPAGGGFMPACKLTGHENWIRSLALTPVTEPGGGTSLLLASSSQDRFARVWAIKQEEGARHTTDGECGVLEHLLCLCTCVWRWYE